MAYAYSRLPGWNDTGRYNPNMAKLFEALRRHRHKAAAWYPNVLTPVSIPSYGGPATFPIATVVRLWRKWDAFTGRCPECGHLLLGCGASGIYSVGIYAVCRGCGLTCARWDVPPTRRGIEEALNGERYGVRMEKFGPGVGSAAPLLAVLRELGAVDLPRIGAEGLAWG